MSGCDQCACYRRGAQDAAEATYAENVAATAEREFLASNTGPVDLLADVQRWHDRG